MRKIVFFIMVFCFLGASQAYGDSFSGKVEPANKDEYTLVIEEDSIVTFTLKDSEKDYIIALYEGNELFASVLTTKEDGDLNHTIQSIALKQGVYKITVNAVYYNDAATYNFTTENSPLTFTDVEPNNTYSQAIPMQFNKTYEGELYNIGYRPSDIDFYKIQTDFFGRLTVNFAINEVESSYKYLIVRLYDKEMNLITSMVGKNAQNLNILIHPGTAYLCIEITNTTAPISNYKISTKFTPLDASLWESGKNTNWQTADDLVNNKTKKGFLFSDYAYSQSADYYRVTLDKDSTVTFMAKSYKNPGQFIFLVGDGTQLPVDGYAVSDTNPLVATRTLKKGTYYVSHTSKHKLEGYEEYDLTMRIQRFVDVPGTHLYYEQIETLAELGINKGYADGTFKPSMAIQRAHVFAFLKRYKGLELTKMRSMKKFADLSLKNPYYNEIKTFYEAGIIDGSGSNMNPTANLTRAQLAKILVKTFGLKMQDEPVAFDDVSPKNEFYEYIQILASNGITTGSNGRFMPTDSVSRQNFSVFLHRILQQ